MHINQLCNIIIIIISCSPGFAELLPGSSLTHCAQTDCPRREICFHNLHNETNMVDILAGALVQQRVLWVYRVSGHQWCVGQSLLSIIRCVKPIQLFCRWRWNSVQSFQLQAFSFQFMTIAMDSLGAFAFLFTTSEWDLGHADSCIFMVFSQSLCESLLLVRPRNSRARSRCAHGYLLAASGGGQHVFAAPPGTQNYIHWMLLPVRHRLEWTVCLLSQERLWWVAGCM